MNKKIFILTLAGLTWLAPVGAYAQSPGKYASVNGMKMYYEIHGQGAPQAMPLVVLHGAYMNIPAMGAIIPRLAKTHQVYALEFQGHGRTSIKRPSAFSRPPTGRNAGWSRALPSCSS